MRNTIFLIAFLICGICFSQNPDRFRDGIRTKLVQPDTLSTADRDALTPKLGTILYHKDTGISRWEQWDGSEWVEFGGEYDVVPRDSLIVQSPSSLGNIYHYWKGTEAQQDSILGLDPNFFDDMLWICTDCPQQGGGGTADQFVMGDSSFKDFIDDDTFASATSTNIPSAESVKAYVDANSFVVESGTFTPAISGLTFTVRKANERKIGDLVFIEVDLINVSGTTGSNGMLLTGFSYGVPSSTNTSLSVGLFTGVSVNYYSVYAEMVGSTTDSVNFTYQFALDGSNASLIPASTTFTAGAIRIAGSYVTDN